MVQPVVGLNPQYHTLLLYCSRAPQFSSDRTIREYADDIWHVKPCRPQ